MGTLLKTAGDASPEVLQLAGISQLAEHHSCHRWQLISYSFDLRDWLSSRHAPKVLLPASNPNRPQNCLTGLGRDPARPLSINHNACAIKCPAQYFVAHEGGHRDKRGQVIHVGRLVGGAVAVMGDWWLLGSAALAGCKQATAARGADGGAIFGGVAILFER